MKPRCILPGRTYLLTRRCQDRRYFLRPSKTTNAIVQYAMARAFELVDVRVHAYVFMSNHMHLVLTDVDAGLPNFMQELDREIARAVGASIGRWNGFWESTRSYAPVELLDANAILDAMVYTIANPVAAGLVASAERWPGITSARTPWGREMVFMRPATNYYAKSTQPRSCSLALSPPPGWAPDELEELAMARVREIEQKTAAELAKAQRSFMGEQAILIQDPHDAPTSWEQRRGLKPRFASKDRWARIEAAQRNADWLEAHEEARLRASEGDRGVVFPAGTWAMCRFFGYESEPPADSTPKKKARDEAA